jgi:hypothetical protein
MVLGFDIAPFEGDEGKIKKAALAKVISSRPDLDGLIDVNDFYDLQESGDEGVIKLRAFGEQLASAVEKYAAESSATPTQESNQEPIEEVSFEMKDVDGTPMAIGMIKVSTPVTPDNEKAITESIIEFIETKHPEVEVDESSLDMANIVNGEVGYMVGISGSDLGAETIEASTDFDIIVKASDSKKN